MKTIKTPARGAIAILAAVFGIAASADVVWPVATTNGTAKGVWMDNFAAATNLATTTKTPAVFVWGNYGCDYCEELENAINGAQFTTWREAHPEFIYNFVFGSGRGGKDLPPNENSGAKEFIRTAGGTASALKDYPFVCLYWPKADGTLSAVRFTGRNGTMGPVSATGKTLAEQLEEAIELRFAGYEPIPPEDAFSFTVSDTEYDRLEAESATQYVDVPVERTPGVAAATNTLAAAWPDKILPAATNTIIWAAGETQKLVRVRLARGGAAFPQGETMTLSMTDAKGNAAAAGAIHFVADTPVSVGNPKFVGEKFDYGEWTMDYEAAKAKDGYVLAYFGGVLWCPYCFGIDTTLFASDAFKKWAADNRVSLVLFDQSRASTPPTAAGSGQARLLSYSAGNSSPLGGIASGAAYLSRKSISKTAAEQRIALTTRFTQKWLVPGSTAARLSNPTLLLVKNDKVVGRFSASRDDDKNYDPAENISRLDDLLALTARDGEENDFPSTATSTLSAAEDAKTVQWQINDKSECFVLSGAATGTLTVSAAAPADVQLELLADGESIASGTNVLETRIRKAHLNAGRLVVRAVAAFPALQGAKSSQISGSIATSFVPGDDSEQVDFAVKFLSSAKVASIDTNGVKSVSFKTVSGALPKGLKLVYDKATGEVLLSGTPRQAGTSKFSFVATVRTSSGKTELEPVEVTVSVEDPTSSNKYVGTAQKTTVPMLDAAGKRLVATGEVKISKTGTVTLKTLGIDGKRVSYSGKWNDFDKDSAVATANLKSLKKTYASVSLAPGGTISVTADGYGGEAAPAGTATRFDGYYTIALPVVSTTAGYPCTGTGVMLATIKKGKATAKITLPNGTAASWSGYIAIDPSDSGHAYLPVLSRKTKDTLAALVRIAADGGKLYSDETTSRVARLGTDAAQWFHNAKGDSFEAQLGAYGCWFPKGESIDNWRTLFGLAEPEAKIDGEPTAAAWKYAKATGLVSSTVKAAAAPAGTSGGKIKAVLTPGWIDCGCAEEEYPGQYEARPFAAGAFVYKMKYNGKTVSASLPFELIAEEK